MVNILIKIEKQEIRMGKIFRVFLLLIFVSRICLYSENTGSYYSELGVLSQPWDTTQKAYVDFTYLIKVSGAEGFLDESSIRLYEVEGEKEIEVPFNFIKENDFDIKDNASGKIIFKVKGEKDPEKANKKFRLYFDTTKEVKKAVAKVDESLKEANLVPNIGFEEEERAGIPARTPYFYSASMQAAFSEGRILLDKQVFYKGEKSVKLIGKEGTDIPIVITPFPGYKKDGFPYVFRVVPGWRYRFGYWTKGSNCAKSKYETTTGNAPMFSSQIYWYDKEGNYISRNTSDLTCKIESYPYSWDWVYKEQIVQAPEKAYYGMFHVQFFCYEGSMWVDEPIIDLAQEVSFTNCYKK